MRARSRKPTSVSVLMLSSSTRASSPKSTGVLPFFTTYVGPRTAGSVPDLLTWVLDRKCEFIAIHEESKDDIMHHD